MDENNRKSGACFYWYVYDLAGGGAVLVRFLIFKPSAVFTRVEDGHAYTTSPLTFLQYFLFGVQERELCSLFVCEPALPTQSDF